MNLNLDKRAASLYRSSSQKARVLTENWVNVEAYCPSCGNTRLDKYSNNKPVADFFCDSCNEDFELKSKKDSMGAKIVDGEYQAMLRRLADIHSPNFFLLNYDLSSYQVSNFLVIPKHFFVPEIIEKRRPLSVSARRAGWTGCNILLNKIPESGRIFLIKDKRVEPKENVYAIWQKTLFLREEKEISAKGWLLDIMRCVDNLGKKEFTLDEVYAFETELSQLHPENKHIKDKIRQQLQFLRDKGYLDFVSRGYYRLI